MTRDRSTTLDRLRGYLCTLPAGEVATPDEQLALLLREAWVSLAGGDETRMDASKLEGRMEKVTWTPPVLTFTIERHGETVMGSSRSRLYRWTV